MRGGCEVVRGERGGAQSARPSLVGVAVGGVPGGVSVLSAAAVSSASIHLCRLVAVEMHRGHASPWFPLELGFVGHISAVAPWQR